jgi:hypothetical protein
MTIKAQEFDRLATKFELKLRDSGDLLAWFEYDGKIITRTRRSKGSGDLPMQHSIRQQLKLNEQQFRDAIGCRLTREGYVEILRGKGLIESREEPHNPKS